MFGRKKSGKKRTIRKQKVSGKKRNREQDLLAFYEDEIEDDEFEEYDEDEDWEEEAEAYDEDEDREEEVEEYDEDEDWDEEAEAYDEDEDREEAEGYDEEESEEYDEDEDWDEEAEEYDEDEDWDEEVEEYGEKEDWDEEDEEYGEEASDEEDSYAYDEEDEDDDELAPVISSRKHRKKKSGKRKKAGVLAGISAFFANMTTFDRLLAAMGVCVLIAMVFTGVAFADRRAEDAQIASFKEIAAPMNGISIVGESGLLAISSAASDRIERAEQEALEEIEREKEEAEDEAFVSGNTVKVSIKLTTIQSDIKIKIINEKSGKLVGGVPFVANVTGDNGKSYQWEDDDKDGIIYHTKIPNGTYQIVLAPLTGSFAESYSLPTGKQSIKVTDQIAYKKVDVKEEIKSESQVNAAIEDTKKHETVQESALQDTVEWVESTKTPIDGQGEQYEKVSKSDIPDPTATARAFRFVKMVEETQAVPGISLDTASVTLKVGESATVNASVTNASGSSVNWVSSNTSVATVSGGVITAVGEGSATITAEIEGASATCGVTVTAGETTQKPEEKPEEKPKDPAQTEQKPGISLSTSGFELKVNESKEISVTLTNQGDHRTISWVSSDSAVASVDGGVVTAKKAGSAVITATLEGTDAQASCTVTVKEAQKDQPSIQLDKTSITLKVKESTKLTAKLSNAGDHQSIHWESSDSSVATVKDGTVQGIKAGKATITATLEGTDATASCSVTVTESKIDLSAPLKDKNGNQMYYKDGNGNYVAATYADYSKYDTFYKKSNAVTQYRYTGWQTIDGCTYYFDKNGNYVTGEHIIQGAKYNFGSDGKLSAGSGKMGIDVSKWNGNIDWNAVKNAGVSYAIIRCGYRGSTTGALIEDPKFKTNIKNAKAAGIDVGVYFFTQAMNEVEAVEEASMVLSLIAGCGVNMPVYLDVEASGGRADGIDKGTRTAVCKAFCQTIQNSGYKAGIYANKTWLTTHINTASLTNFKIWLAQYASAPTYTATRYDMWQYSDRGRINGISTNVDLNIRYN